SGGPGVGLNPNQRSFYLPEGSTSILAEHIGRVMSGIGRPTTVIDPNAPHRPSVLNPGTTVPPLNGAPKTPFPKNLMPGSGATPNLPTTPTAPARASVRATPRVPANLREPLPGRDIRYIGAQVVDPEKKDKKAIKIEVQGNRLIVTSDDPESL